MSKVQSLDQERAAYAWKQTDPAHVKDRYAEFAKLAAGAPALVMSNGLMQTLAFYRDKNNAHHKALLDALLTRLAQKVLGTGSKFEEVMKALHSTDSDTYMRATEEALETLKWIRQFAKARNKEDSQAR